MEQQKLTRPVVLVAQADHIPVHVGAMRFAVQAVRDAFMAVDAGLFPGGERGRVLSYTAPTLFREIHEIELMAVATFLRIVQAHALPFALGQMPTPCLKFFDGIDDVRNPIGWSQ